MQEVVVVAVVRLVATISFHLNKTEKEVVTALVTSTGALLAFTIVSRGCSSLLSIAQCARTVGSITLSVT
jgi:tellurite resistance protein